MHYTVLRSICKLKLKQKTKCVRLDRGGE
jgi:hypothetical protein